MGKSTLFLDILLFLVTAAFAWYEQWSAKDLVWSLWISSLVLGYSYILTSIFGGLLRGDPVLIYGSQEKKEMHSNFPLELSVIIMNIFGFLSVMFFLGGVRLVCCWVWLLL